MVHNIIVKVTLDCNIRCRYCYVRRNRDPGDSAGVMSEDTLAALIRTTGDYLATNAPSSDFVFYWHGGEPLRAGPQFFERCRALQKRYLPSDIPVVNTIQTNGILVTDEWARVIKRGGYGVCVSLDGPAEVHDEWRRTPTNTGTHNLVLRGIETLRRHEIPVSILAVITPPALGQGARIYRTFRALGCCWMDFMYPFYSLIDNTIDAEVAPAAWGDFLVDVFDAWMAEANPDVTVRLLHDLCMALMHGRTQMCISGIDCSYVVTVYPGGDVFICDDLLAYADSRLGHVHRDSLSALSCHPLLTRLKDPCFLFGDDCRRCTIFDVCRGGCTLFRARRRNDFLGRHYFCASQRRIISHITQYLGKVAAAPEDGGRATPAAPPVALS